MTMMIVKEYDKVCSACRSMSVDDHNNDIIISYYLTSIVASQLHSKYLIVTASKNYWNSLNRD